jgi:hypothetical protein
MCGFDAIKQDVLRKATGKTIDFLQKQNYTSFELHRRSIC